VALDRKTGQERWRSVTGEDNYIINKQNMATPSPVTDGKHVWVLTGTGKLSCFDFQGKQIWQRDIVKDYGEFGLNWGYGSSPLLHEGKLFVQVLHGMKTDDPSYVLRIDPQTGKTLWRAERPTDAINETPDSYSTPMIAKVGGKTRLVVCGGGYLTVHDIDTGKEVSRAGGLDPTKDRAYRTIASSTVAGDLVFAPSRRRPFIAFRLTSSGEGSLEQLWSTEYGPDVPTPTIDGERLYIVDDRGILLCVRTTDGTVIWDRDRLEPGTYSASLVLADGKIYATSEDGTTTVVKAGGNFEILSVNKLNDYTLASPAVAGENIFIRTANYLYCLGKKTSSAD
jgi:outer membrane protein assembly factor BamB